jgi:hypothetical protein
MKKMIRTSLIAWSLIGGAVAHAATSTVSFPAGPSSTAIHASWSSSSFAINVVDADIWHENGLLWIKIDPGAKADFVCGSDFKVVQSGIQYDAKLVSQSTSSFCGDLYVPSVMQITGWYGDKPFDSNGTLTLLIEGTPHDIPAGPPLPASPSTPTAPVDSTPGVIPLNLDGGKAMCKSGRRTVGAGIAVDATGQRSFRCNNLKAKVGRKVIITFTGRMR